MHSEAPEVIERDGSAHTAKQLYSMAGEANFRIISLVRHISEVDLCWHCFKEIPAMEK